MAKKREEREFQLEMLRLEIKHQDVLSALTLFFAIEFSAMVSLVTTYLTIYINTGNRVWLLATIAIFPLFGIAMFLTLRYYGGQGARKIEENLQQDIQKIRNKFIDKKPVDEGKE